MDQAESQGCLDLLRDGATLVRKSADILEEVEPMLDFASLSYPSSDLSVNKKDYSSLDDDEQVIMENLKEGDAFTVDHFHQVTQLALPQIMSTLTMLEIQGLIQKRTDGSYEAT